MVSGTVTAVPRVDTAVIFTGGVPGSTVEDKFDKLQLPKTVLTVAVPITGPEASPTWRVIIFPGTLTVLFPLTRHHFKQFES